jgi:transposase InsO family protein
MSTQRKQYSAEFKARVALEALTGLKTVNELARTYGVHPTQMAHGKHRLQKEMPEIFSARRAKREQAHEAFHRYVLSWAVSITMDVGFCREVLDHALEVARPEIFNTDQGAQFTSFDFAGRLTAAGSQISMDGRGWALDNVFVERLWRTVKYEEVYVKDYETPREAMQGLGTFFLRYNEWRQHQALSYQTPASVYFGSYL